MSFVRGHRRTRTQAEVNVLEACKVNSSLPLHTLACTTAKTLDLSDKFTKSSPATSSSSVCLPAIPVARNAQANSNSYTLKNLSVKESTHATSLKEYRFPKIDSSKIIIAPVIVVPVSSSTTAPPADLSSSSEENHVLIDSETTSELPAGQDEVNTLKEASNDTFNISTFANEFKSEVSIEASVERVEGINEKLKDPSPPLDSFFREHVTKCMMQVIKNGRTRRLVESTLELPSLMSNNSATTLIRRDYKCREKSSALYLNSGISKTYQMKLWEPIVSPTLVS